MPSPFNASSAACWDPRRTARGMADTARINPVNTTDAKSTKNSYRPPASVVSRVDPPALWVRPIQVIAAVPPTTSQGGVFFMDADSLSMVKMVWSLSSGPKSPFAKSQILVMSHPSNPSNPRL